jgi:hypothetical protein
MSMVFTRMEWYLCNRVKKARGMDCPSLDDWRLSKANCPTSEDLSLIFGAHRNYLQNPV